MKKTFLLLICLLGFRQYPFAQVQDTIPNAGFEGWIFGGWGMNPGSWDTNNSQLMMQTVDMDSNSYSGDLAMKMINGGSLRPYAACHFLITYHPLALYGYVRNELFSNDSAILQVHLYLNNLLVDSGYQVMYGGINPNYASFSIPITQNSLNADSCVITFYGGTQYLSSLTFDELFFTFPSAIFEVESSAIFTAGPNPTGDLLSIDLQCGSCNQNAFVIMYDMTGRKIREEKLTSSNRISLKELPQGVYLLNIRVNNKNETQLIIKE